MDANGRQRAEDIIHTAQVVRHGDKLIVPQSMELKSAITVLTQQMKDEEEIIAINEVVDAFPWEGAIAFRKAIELTFGFGGTIGIQTFFGKIPPQEISVEVGVDKRVQVPWGRFRFALGGEGEWLSTGTDYREGRIVFCINGNVKKKWKATIAKLAELTRQLVDKESIYRGQAIRINFTNEESGLLPMPEPRFIDLSKVDVNELVYTQDLTQLIETNILTPIKHAAQCRAAGIPLKRGILAAGQYGTGKSLLARAVAKVATSNGWTFIYIKDASELPHALKFAQMYQPAVIFGEDVDRFMAGGRTAEMDTILNTLDGIDSKTSEIMVVLTTNHLEQINKAMLRPGRLDVVLNIVPPDAEAVQRLVRVYGRGLISDKTNLAEVGTLLAGQTPAVIREVVERSKLASISRTGKASSKIEGVDIEVAAKTMVQQQALLAPTPDKEPNVFELLATGIAVKTHEKMLDNGLGKGLKEVREIHDQIVGS